jgi:Lon protease-like protein
MELPLFPLRTVLFPGMPITLHIFELRYRKMIQSCLKHQDPFGVVLIKRGREAQGPLAEPHPIGCTARIIQVERLKDGGRMNIIAIGGERFQILAHHTHDDDYMVGHVETLPLETEDPLELRQSGDCLRPWVRRYLDILENAHLVEGELDELPQRPLDLAYLAAFLLQVPSLKKQELLEVDQASQLLIETRDHYRREIALLENLITSNPKGDTKGARLN